MNPISRFPRAIPVLLVVGVVAALIWPVLRYGFVLHDDPQEIVLNRDFQPMDPAALGRVWSRPDFSRIYIPVNYTVLGVMATVSRWWNGLGVREAPAPGIFHAVGVFLHLLNTGMVVCLLRRLTGGAGGAGGALPWAVVLAGLAFGLHPAQVESYARAGNLTVTLGGTWALLALWCLLKGSRGVAGAGRWQAAGTVFFCLGLLTRPTVVALPVAAMALLWIFEGASWRRLLSILWPWLLAGTAYAALSLWLHPVSQATGGVAWYWRPVVAADSLMWYITQTLWPVRLSLDHGRTPAAILQGHGVWVSLAGIAALALVAFVGARGAWRPAAAGALCFLAMLVPVSGLVPAAYREGVSVVYDRHLYLPLFGAALVFATGLGRLPRDWIAAVGMPLVCVLAVRTHGYQKAWADSIPLFENVIAVNPASWYGHGQMGTALLFSGQLEPAARHLARAIELNPRLVDARINLGQALLDMERNAEAENVLREAVNMDPLQDNAHNNLAAALIRREAWEEAEEAAKEAIRLNGEHVLARSNLLLALAGQGKTLQALDEAAILTAMNPDFALGWRTLGQVLLESGSVDQAMVALARACELDPSREDWIQTLRGLKDEFGEPPRGTRPLPAQ